MNGYIYILWTVAVILVLFFIGVIIRDSNRFHRVSYRIIANEIKENFHFVFLSDLHNKQYGENQEKLLAAIDEIGPEAVVIGGDLLTARPGEALQPALDLVQRLQDKYPVYYANGNHEYRLELYPDVYGDMGDRYEEGLQKIGIDRLKNESAFLEEKNIQITGCEIDKGFYKRFRKEPMEPGYLDEILPIKREGYYQLLLAHNPDYFDEYASWGADLTLSGHVHGGVVRLPFLGGVLSTNFTLFPHYDGGLFEKWEKTMIISRGLGAHTIPLRMFNPGELIEITLEKPSKKKLQKNR